jgi:hypothetical protein
MKPLLITGAATVAALVVVLSTRVVIPAFILVFRFIEASFAPEEPAIAKALPVSVEPVIDVSAAVKADTVVSKPKRATRKRSVKKTTPLGDVLLASSVSTDVVAVV